MECLSMGCYGKHVTSANYGFNESKNVFSYYTSLSH